MPSVLDTSNIRRLGGADNVFYVEQRNGEQYAIEIECTDGVNHVDITGDTLTTEVTMRAMDIGRGGTPRGFADAATLNLPSGTSLNLPDWDSAIVEPTDGTLQVAVPLNWCPINPGADDEFLPVAECVITKQKHSNERDIAILYVINRHGQESPSGATQGIPDTTENIHAQWNTKLASINPSPTPTNLFTGLSNSPPPTVGLPGTSTAGSSADAGYTTALRGTAKAEIDSTVAERLVPAGGTADQVLKKSTGTDYDVEWADDEQGMGGGGTAGLADGVTIDGDGSAIMPYMVKPDSIGRQQLSANFESEIDTRHSTLSARIDTKLNESIQTVPGTNVPSNPAAFGTRWLHNNNLHVVIQAGGITNLRTDTIASAISDGHLLKIIDSNDPTQSGVTQAALTTALNANGSRVMQASAVTYNAPARQLTVQVSHMPRNGDAVLFNMPSTPTEDSGAVLIRATTDGSTFSASLSLDDIDGDSFAPNHLVSGRTYLAFRVSASEYRLLEGGGGSGGTMVTANPTDAPTATLMNMAIADTVFRVGRATYYDSGASPFVAGIATPRVHGEIAVNNQGDVYPAVTKREQHGSTPPSVTVTNFDPTDFYEFTSSTVGNRGDFYHFVDDYFIQNQTVPGGADNFPHVTFHDAWDYIVTNVTGGNTAEYRGYRDDYIWIGEHDNLQQVAEAISHHADKADNTKTFVFSLELNHRVQQVATFTDRMGIFVDALSWGGKLTDVEDALQLISQYQSIRDVNAGYQPTAMDYAANALLKIGDHIYRVTRSAPMDHDAQATFDVVSQGTTIRYNGGTVDHRYRGAHHHDSDVSNPQDQDLYVVFNRQDVRVYDVRNWRDRHVVSMQIGANDGPWRGHFESQSEALDHVQAVGDYVGVGYELRRVTAFIAATTDYTYALENIVGDIPRLTQDEAVALDYLAFISPDDATVTVGLHGTGTARVLGFIPDDSVGSMDPNFDDVDDQINRIYYVPEDYSVETGLRGKICIERTETSDSEELYDGMALRARDVTGSSGFTDYVLETFDYITDDGRRRYATTTTVPSGQHWDDTEEHQVNIQNPSYVRTTLGTPWLFHRSLGGDASEASLTLDAVKAFARATGQSGSRAVRGTDLDEDTITERQLLFQNTNVNDDTYLPVLVGPTETSGYVKARIQNKDIVNGTIEFEKLQQAASIQNNFRPLLGLGAAGFAFGQIRAVDIGDNAITVTKYANRSVSGAKIALDTITESNLNVHNEPSDTNNSLGWDEDNSRLVWQPEGSGGTGTTNLGLDNRDGTTLDITSSTGTDVTVPAATASMAGLITGASQGKLNALATNRQLPAGGTANQVLVKDTATNYDVSWADQSGMGGATNLTIGSRGVNTLDVESSTGTNATVPAATTTLAGLLTSADKTKLDSLELQITMVPTANVTYNTNDSTDLSSRFGSDPALTVNLDVAGNADAEIDDLFVFQFRQDISSLDDDLALGIRINSSTALPIRIVDPTTQAFVNKRVENTARYTFFFLTRQDGVFIELSPTMDLANLLGRTIPSGGSNNQVLTKASGTSYDVEWTTPGAASLNIDGLTTRTPVSGDEAVIESGGNNFKATLGNIAEFAAGHTADGTTLTFSSGDGELSITDGGVSVAKLSTAAQGRLIPSGGADGQVLAKSAATDYAVEWITPSGGSGSTNITVSYENANNRIEIESSSGTNAFVNAASSTSPGVMTSGDKTKLDRISGRGAGMVLVSNPQSPFGWSVNSLSVDLDSSYDTVGQILAVHWDDNIPASDESAAVRLRLGNTGNFTPLQFRAHGSTNFRDMIGSDLITDQIYVIQRTSTRWRVLFAATTDGTSPDIGDFLTQAQIDTRVQDTVEYQQTLWLPATTWEPQSTAPPARTVHNGSSDGPDTHGWAFDSAAVEKIQTNVALPDNWNAGAIQFRVYWYKDNAVTGNVLFGLRGISVADGASSSTGVYGAQINVQDANQDSLDVAITPWSGDVTLRNAARNAITYLELERDADNGSDTLANDAVVLGVEVRFTCAGIDAA